MNFFLFLSPSSQNAQREESLRNLVVAADENLQENDVPVEERLVYPYCFNQCGTFPFCHSCKKN